jgi:hypothetical protein
MKSCFIDTGRPLSGVISVVPDIAAGQDMVQNFVYWACKQHRTRIIMSAFLFFLSSQWLNWSLGEIEAISAVKVGDQVLSFDRHANTGFAPIVSIPHPRNSIWTQAAKIKTRTGKMLQVTKGHVVGVSAYCHSAVSVLRASQIFRGCVFSQSLAWGLSQP